MSTITKPKSTPEQEALLLGVVVALVGNIIFLKSLSYFVATLVVAFLFVPRAEALRTKRTLLILLIGSTLVSVWMGLTAMGCRCFEGSRGAGVFRQTLFIAIGLNMLSLLFQGFRKKPLSVLDPIFFLYLLLPVVVGILVRIGVIRSGTHVFISTM